LVLVNSKIG